MTPTSAIEHLRQSRSDLHRQFAISSTNREHGRADFGGLWGAGFPDPVLGNTGNGTHLLYPVDLPNDSDKYALAKRPKKRPLLHARQEHLDACGQLHFQRTSEQDAFQDAFCAHTHACASRSRSYAPRSAKTTSEIRSEEHTS